MKNFLKPAFHFFGLDLRRYNPQLKAYNQLFDKYATYTMMNRNQFIANLELCAQFRFLEGDYIECGVWKGGMSAAIAELIGNPRMIHLFDSFEGLPPAREIDGESALRWQKQINSEGYFDNCRADEKFAVDAMRLARHVNYRMHKGWFQETLPALGTVKIAILRLDGDWYDSITTCLENLYPKVIDGGLIILDDYYTWDGCAKAVHDYLSVTKSPSRIYEWPNQVAYIIKKR